MTDRRRERAIHMIVEGESYCHCNRCQGGGEKQRSRGVTSSCITHIISSLKLKTFCIQKTKHAEEAIIIGDCLLITDLPEPGNDPMTPLSVGPSRPMSARHVL